MFRSLSGIIATILLHLACCSSSAQVLPIQFYSTREGLPSNHITAIHQDSRGYLWIGTDNGLSRYDGTAFKNFTTADGLSNLYITDLLESRLHPGRLWIGTIAGGVVRYEGDRFVSIPIGNNHVGSLREDEHGTLWCSAESGNYRIVGDSACYVGATDDKGSEIQVLPGKGSLIFTAHRLEFHDLNGTLRRESHLALAKDELVVASAIDQDSILWAYSSEGTLLQLRDSSITYLHPNIPFRPSLDIPSHLMDDGQGALWLTTPGGVAVINKSTLTYRVLGGFGATLAEPSGAILRDREGSTWFGTYAQGLAKLSEDRIYRFSLDAINEGAYNLAACSDSGGRIWISTPGALLEAMRGGEGTWTLFKHSVTPWPVGSGLRIDSRNRLWIGPTTSIRSPYTCYSITPVTGNPSRLTAVLEMHPEAIDRRGVGLTFAIDRHGREWISLFKNGVACFDIRDKNRTRLFEERDGLPADPIREIMVDRNDSVWCGSWNVGVAIAHAGGNTFRTVTEYQTLRGTGVRSLHEDRQGSIWIGTRYGGIVRRSEGRFASVSVANGLLSNAIWSIGETEHRIWCGTDVGLEVIDKKSCRPLTPKSELLGKRVYACGAFGNEYVWCVTAHDLIIYEHPEIETHSPPPPVYIQSFSVNGTGVAPDDRHTFSFDQNSCTLSFVGLSFRDESSVRYQYRMLGHDSSWTAPVKEHTVAYASLGPGAYVFEVRAINADGVVSTSPASASFIIVPPVWQRWWFMLGIVLLIAAGLYGLFRYRLYHLMNLERLRLRIAGDLHDDVGTNLSSIMIASQIIENQLPVASEQRRHISELRGRAASTQEMLKDIVWLLNPANDSIGDFVLKLQEIARRQLPEIPVAFTISGEQNFDALGLDARRNIVLFFKEAITNAARHSHATTIAADLSVRGDLLSLSVTDNGSGFEAQNPRKGNGLSNLRMRADNLGGSVEIRSEIGRGTTIRLSARIPNTRSIRRRSKSVR
jgi:ligand-binding sensor domain-containing protein